jgi:hypothetical protein
MSVLSPQKGLVSIYPESAKTNGCIAKSLSRHYFFDSSVSARGSLTTLGKMSVTVDQRIYKCVRSAQTKLARERPDD